MALNSSLHRIEVKLIKRPSKRAMRNTTDVGCAKLRKRTLVTRQPATGRLPIFSPLKTLRTAAAPCTTKCTCSIQSEERRHIASNECIISEAPPTGDGGSLMRAWMRGFGTSSSATGLQVHVCRAEYLARQSVQYHLLYSCRYNRSPKSCSHSKLPHQCDPRSIQKTVAANP